MPLGSGNSFGASIKTNQLNYSRLEGENQMENKIAIGMLQSRISLMKSDYPQIAKYGEALELAVKALEKQIKKKYMRKGNQEICPCCGNDISRIAPKEDYCHKCGQKIYWR